MTSSLSLLSVLSIVAIPISIIGFVCWIFIVIDAFKNEIWKGVLSLICGIYAVVYGVTEFDHEKRNIILPGYLIAVVFGLILRGYAIFSAVGSH